jgi:hypothetical protein
MIGPYDIGGGVILVVVGGLLAALFRHDSSARSRLLRRCSGTGRGSA